MGDLRAGQPGEPGQSGTVDHGGQGGQGGAGGAGGSGDSGGAGGGGGAGGDYLDGPRRQKIATLATWVLVGILPLFAYVYFTDRNAQERLHQQVAAADLHALAGEWRQYDEGVAACERAEVVRDNQNAVINELRRRESRFNDPRFRLVDDEGNQILPNAPVNCKKVVSPPAQPRPEREPSS